MENEIKNKNYNERTIVAEARQFEPDFIQTIKDRLGLEVHKHQVNLMIKTIINACKKFNYSPENYLDKLRASSSATPEIEYLIGGITIGETYFFRDKKQMKVISEYLLPEIIENKRSNNTLSLRIWSAGCSSGEEIYSIAMYLVELLKDIENWKISLIATDINVDQLRKGAFGEYGEWSMRSIPVYFKDHFFIKKKNKYHLSKDIIKMVEFEYLNLNDNNYPSLLNNTNSLDLILCRNVLIYFDEKKSKTILERLSSCLEMGGYLMLGASDPLYISSKLLVVNPNCATLFKKEPFPLVKKKSVSTLKRPEIKIPDIDSYKYKEKKLDIQSEKIQEAKPLLNCERDAENLIEQESWNDLIQLVEFNKMTTLSVNILIGYATALANVGRQDEAIQELEKLLVNNKTNVNIYLVYALTLIEQNRLSEAESMLRQAIFLDRKLVIAYFQLGLLLMRNSKHSEGIKCLNNALALANSFNPLEVVKGGNGLTYGKIKEILTKEIQIYSTKRINYE